jgi:hypothetical protein
VLAELVGRATTPRSARPPPAHLFNDEVPSRPDGSPTSLDWHRRRKAHHRAVLAALVARSEDQQLRPGPKATPPSRSWRWPGPCGRWRHRGHGEPQLPNRRLAKSG